MTNNVWNNKRTQKSISCDYLARNFQNNLKKKTHKNEQRTSIRPKHTYSLHKEHLKNHENYTFRAQNYK